MAKEGNDLGLNDHGLNDDSIDQYVNPPIHHVVDDQDRPIREHVVPILNNLNPGIGSSWVSLVQYVPKKGGVTIVSNDNNELIPTRTITGWRVCMDYRKLNKIAITPNDQEKTIITCPYGTFSFRRMSFRLCNALETFQHCMMVIFSDMVKNFLEVFMNDFSVFGNDFADCFKNLELVLCRCEETNLVLNWEKCHFDLY
ncbi:uncharacterized protein [Gossypium hirsutum]|uniref:RNA-directed DNA polymerase homolog n=1 Tax=Gossypium hirsutum TaxID=3635 RepID=A0A1U8I507_GOSHI|nr:uncharacterized protein LOC107892753 [Gossypium hirsutum]